MNRNKLIVYLFTVCLFPLFLLSATWTYTTAATEPISTRPVICADPLGHLHVAWTANDPYGETLHYASNQSGAWSYAKQVAGSYSNTAYTPSITVDRFGFAYIVARFYSYYFNIRYFTNAFETSTFWTGMTAMGNAHYHESSIEVDSDGNTHVFAQEDTWGSNVFYQNHDLADVVIEGGTSQFFATAIDPDDVLHFAGSHSSNIWYTYNDGNGWNTPDSIDQLDVSTYHPSIACDTDGHLHVVFASANGIYYTNNISGTWSVPEQATSSGIFPNVAVDKNGKAHIAYYTQVEYGGLFYVNNIGGSWSTGELITTINTDGSSATEDAAHVESKIALDLKSNTVNIVYVSGGNNVVVASTSDYNLMSLPTSDSTNTLVDLAPQAQCDTLGTAVSGTRNLLHFRINDLGGDMLHTMIESFVFQSGPGMSDDIAFNDIFSSVELSTATGMTFPCSIYARKIIADSLTGSLINIPEGTSMDFTLKGTYKSDLGNIDGKSIQVKLNGRHDVITDRSHSGFSPGCLDVVSDTLLFMVEPDHFIFLHLGDDFYNENLILGFWMQLQIVDAAGNVATGVSGVDVSLSAVDPDGTTPAPYSLQSSEGLTKTFSNGVVNWNNLSYPSSGQIKIQATCDLLTSVSDTVTVMPFNRTLLITADDTISDFLNSEGIAHDTYHEGNYQFPTASNIQSYDHILLCPSSNYIWYIDSTKIRSFLESGSDTSRKSLLAMGENALGNHYDSPFARDCFGATRGQLFSHNGSGISGVTDDPVSNGVHLSLPAGNMYEIVPESGAAVPVLHEDQTGKTVGARFEKSAFRTVILAPEFRNLSANNGRADLFSQILIWFDNYSVPTYPPTLDSLPDILMMEDKIHKIPLADWESYVNDPDTPFHELGWMAGSTPHVSVSWVEDTLLLTPQENYFGNDTMVVTVDDGEYEAYDTVLITVQPVNDAPAMISLVSPSNESAFADTDHVTLSWTPSSDIDNDTLYYDIHLSSVGFDSLITLLDETSLYLDDLTVFPSDTAIQWSVSVRDAGDSLRLADNAPFLFTVILTETSIDLLPETFVVLPNYPNPFNPSTTFRIGLPQAAQVHIVAYDMYGRKIAQLVNGELKAGYHSLVWQAGHLPSGIYIIRVNAGDEILSRKVVLLK